MPDVIKDTLQRIDKFNQCEVVQKLKFFYSKKSMLETLGVERNELAHSKFIAWILDSNEYHGVGHFALEKLFQMVSSIWFNSQIPYLSHDREKQDFFNNFWAEVLCGKIVISNDYTVTTEEAFKYKNESRRSDIVIRGKLKLNKRIDNSENASVLSDGEVDFLLVIENKVGTSEHSEQTKSYYDYYFDNEIKDKEGAIFIPLFLTPISNSDLQNLEEQQCSSKEFIQINYQNFLDYVLLHCNLRTISEQARYLITDYMRGLSIRSLIEDDDQESKKELVMAVSHEEMKLLNEFWEKHESLMTHEILYECITGKKNNEKVSEALKLTDYRCLIQIGTFEQVTMGSWKGIIRFKNDETLEAYIFISDDKRNPDFIRKGSDNGNEEGKLSGAQLTQKAYDKNLSYRWSDHWKIKVGDEWKVVSDVVKEIGNTQQQEEHPVNQYKSGDREKLYALLNDFWISNQKMIQASINARMLNDDLSDDVKKALKNLLHKTKSKIDYSSLKDNEAFKLDACYNESTKCFVLYFCTDKDADCWEEHLMKFVGKKVLIQVGEEWLSGSKACQKLGSNSSGAYQWSRYWYVKSGNQYKAVFDYI